MKKVGISVMFDEEKLSATKMYMSQKNLDVKTELEKALDGMYVKYVPSNVREFIDMKEQTDFKPKTEKTKKKSEVEVPGE